MTSFNSGRYRKPGLQPLETVFPAIALTFVLLIYFVAQLAPGIAAAPGGGTAARPHSGVNGGELPGPGPAAGPNTGSGAGGSTGGIFVRVTSAATLHVKGQRKDLAGLKQAVADERFRDPRAPVVLVVEEGARAALLFRAIDACKAAGATDIRFEKAQEAGSP